MNSKRKLFIGPASWRFGDTPTDSDAFAVLELADGPADVNTVLLTEKDVIDSKYWYVSCSGEMRDCGHVSRYPFYNIELIDQISLMFNSAAAPLLMVAEDDGCIRLFGQIRTGGEDILFMWCGELDGLFPESAWGSWAVKVLIFGLRALEANKRMLNNHQFYYRKFLPEMEIEEKLTLPPGVDIYSLAVHFRNLIGGAGFSQYIWEYRDDFQQWDFDNYLYVITEPPPEAGYVSFIPDSKGSVVVKRKWFVSDSVIRREAKWPGIQLNGEHSDYITREFGVSSRFLGCFRRTRFDVSLESVVTGNVFSIMIDRCQFYDQNWPDLCQIEIEYLHSRTLRSSAGDAIMDELKTIVTSVKLELNALRITYTDNPMSKLTYMKRMMESSGLTDDL